MAFDSPLNVNEYARVGTQSVLFAQDVAKTETFLDSIFLFKTMEINRVSLPEVSTSNLNRLSNIDVSCVSGESCYTFAETVRDATR